MRLRLLTTLVLTATIIGLLPLSTPAQAETASSIYDFTVTSIDGTKVPLSHYKGDVLMVVNTASLCGNTPQYKALEAIYEKYKDQKFMILGFPSNDFASQEPGTDASIKEFCTSKFHVSFDMFDKIDVKGTNQAPLYAWLTSPATDPGYSGEIGWNFAKFIIGRDGQVVARYMPTHYPDSPDVTSEIETELAK